LTAALLFVGLAATFAVTRSHWLDDRDSVNFAFALDDFDVTKHWPHPPGYPIYVAAGKLIPLAVFVVAGLFFLDPARFSLAVLPGYRPFSQSVMLLVYAFTGFEMSVIPAGEARKPGRDLPVALMVGMSVVVVFYVLIQVVAIGTLPELAGSQRPLAECGGAFSGARRRCDDYRRNRCLSRVI
jgi:amino acid transporter